MAKIKKSLFYFRMSAGRVYAVAAANYQEAEEKAKQKNKAAQYIGSPQPRK